MNLREIYGKRFTFQATSYEEYEKGVCTGRGSLNASIQSKIGIDQESYRQSGIAYFIYFHIDSDHLLNTRFDFGIPILGINNGDILDDRIQYGRMMNFWSPERNDDPVACHIFDNLHCLRLCFQSPMRIIEFQGSFTSVG